MDEQDCIRCREAKAVTETGLCGHCYWALRAEVDQGYAKLRQYLLGWARFANWLEEHDA